MVTLIVGFAGIGLLLALCHWSTVGLSAISNVLLITGYLLPISGEQTLVHWFSWPLYNWTLIPNRLSNPSPDGVLCRVQWLGVQSISDLWTINQGILSTRLYALLRTAYPSSWSNKPNISRYWTILNVCSHSQVCKISRWWRLWVVMFPPLWDSQCGLISCKVK
jgi:hypothetical protein